MPAAGRDREHIILGTIDSNPLPFSKSVLRGPPQSNGMRQSARKNAEKLNRHLPQPSPRHHGIKHRSVGGQFRHQHVFRFYLSRFPGTPAPVKTGLAGEK